MSSKSHILEPDTTNENTAFVSNSLSFKKALRGAALLVYPVFDFTGIVICGLSAYFSYHTLEIGKQFPEITGAASDAFAAELMKAEDSDFTEVILDFEGTETISSMAMGSIFATHQKMAEQSRKLIIINASDKIKRLLRMVNMAHLLVEEGELPAEGEGE